MLSIAQSVMQRISQTPTADDLDIFQAFNDGGHIALQEVTMTKLPFLQTGITPLRPLFCERPHTFDHFPQILQEFSKRKNSLHLIPAPSVTPSLNVTNNAVAGRTSRCNELHLDVLHGTALDFQVLAG